MISERNPTEANLGKLFDYLDLTCVRLPEFGCYVALSQDWTTIFTCSTLSDGSPEQCPDDARHLNWGEVTAPEPEFIEHINVMFGTFFKHEHFTGR